MEPIKATLYNPETKDRQAVISGSQQAQDLFGQGFQLETSYDPITGISTVAPPTPPSVVGIDESKNQISQGSEEPRDNVTATQNEFNRFNADMDDTGVDTTGVDIGAEFESLKELNANLKTTSAAELMQIEEAGEAAGAEYNPLIAEAMESARMGQAKNIVATGRRGGFQRAKYAGQAALGPTEGDVGYEGAGGKLEAFASAYQRNIDALNAQKMRAIALAKAQARKAIQTGKQQDFANAKDMLAFARQINQDIKDADQVQWERTFKEGQEDRKETEAEQAAARLKERLEFDKQKFEIGEARMARAADLAEDKFNYNVSQDMIDRAIANIENMANSGIPLEQFSDEDIRKLEYETGMYGGTFEAFYSDLLDERAQGNMIDDLKIKKMQVDISNVYSSIAKRSKTGVRDDDNKEKDKFFAELNSASNRLRAGATWGQTFNTLFAKYKTGDSAQDQALTQLIDSSLDKDYWSQEGAYQQFKSSAKTKNVISTVFNEDGTKTIIYSDGSRETF